MSGTEQFSLGREEENLEDVMRAQHEQYAAQILERERIPEMMEEAYRHAWTDFYAWEPDYCAQTLNSLQVSSVAPPILTFTDLLSPSKNPAAIMDEDDLQPEYSQWFPGDSQPMATVFADTVADSNARSTQFGYPKYESCTPATRSISHELDVRVLQFVPYADEGKIEKRLKSLTGPYGTFAWQTEWYDVDCELANLFRLLYRHLSRPASS